MPVKQRPRKSARARNVPILGVAVVVLTLGPLGCSAPRPPTGDELHLKGAQGAQCITGQDCESGVCQRLSGYSAGSRCTAKIEQVGLGGSCRSNTYCQQGFYCDLRASRCAPVLRCEQFRDKMKECVEVLYTTFRPRQARRLQRMRAAAKELFLRRIFRILFDGLCTQTRNPVPYRKGALLYNALRQPTCAGFAKYYRAGIGN